MREYESRAHNKRSKRPDSILRWFSWNSLSTDIRKRKLRTPGNIHSYDRSSGTDEFNFALTWYNYKLAITIASITAFFTGIGQLIFKLMGA